MDIDNILQNSDINETTAFLLSFISTTISEDNNNFYKEQVFANIDQKISLGPSYYLDPICYSVAEELNKKNIFSLASVKTDEYIYLILDKLSQENYKIFKEKYKENKKNYFIKFKKNQYFGIYVKNDGSEEKISNNFLKYILDFKMQDVQRGFFNEKNFLMNICNCEKVEGIKEFKNTDIKIVFDIKKMDKTFREYLKISGYEQYYFQEEHRIYLNDFYYNAHKNFLNYIKQNKT